MEKMIFRFVHDEARRRAAAYCMVAPEGSVAEFKDATRTLQENSLLHALISEVSRKLEWAGEKRDVETWKRLLVAAWCRVEGHSIEILPALDGHGVDIIPARTSKLSKRECADLIEYIYAWGIDKEIEWDDYITKDLTYAKER